MSKRSRKEFEFEIKDNEKMTHYFVNYENHAKKKKYSDKSYFKKIFIKLVKIIKFQEKNKYNIKFQSHKTPLLKLFNGEESDSNVKKRFFFLQSVWLKKQKKINEILHEINKNFFDEIIEFIEQPLYKKQTNDKINLKYKLPICFLHLGLNLANNSRVIKEFKDYLKQKKNEGIFKIIILNQKSFKDIKSLFKDVVSFFVLNKIDNHNDSGIENNSSDSDENNHQNPDFISESSNKLDYDLSIISEWCDDFFRKNNDNIETTELRIVVIIEDFNMVNNNILNQFFTIICSKLNEIPFKIILPLLSENVTVFINNNFTYENRLSMIAYNYKLHDDNDICNLILSKLFLNYEFDNFDLLLPSLNLSIIIRNRFEKSENSIDSIIATLKLCFMIYFYQLPLIIMLDENIDFDKNLYIKTLRHLPSFKSYIEKFLFQNKNKTDISYKKKLTDLFKNTVSVSDVFSESIITFKIKKLCIVNCVNLLFQIQSFVVPSTIKPQFEIYKIIINNKLLKSKFLINIFNLILQESNEYSSILINKILNLFNHEIFTNKDFLNDVNLNEFYENLYVLNKLSDKSNLRDKFIIKFQTYLNKKDLYYPFDKCLFNELFVLTGGEMTSISPLCEENYENLTLNLIRSNLRSTIEMGLEKSFSYLNNNLIKELVLKKNDVNDTTTKSKQIKDIPLNNLFKVYKEAPITINIFDFYIAFKNTFIKEEIINFVKEKKPDIKIDDDSSYCKLIYSWFVQCCHDFLHLGFLKEKNKCDFFEKSVWVKI